MRILNHIINIVADAGLSEQFYAGWNNFAVVAAVVFCFCYSKKLNIGRVKALIGSYLITVLLGEFSGLALWAESGFSSFGKKNIVAGFVFAPICAYFIAKVFSMPWKKTNFLTANICMILHGFYRVGCIFAGCCRGYTSAWGIYNPFLKQICIPVQLMETLVSFAIVGFLVHRNRKIGDSADGQAIPIMLVCYGIARFFLEYLHDNVKIAFGCTNISFHCLLMCVIGIMWLTLISRKVQDVVKKA